MRGHCAAAMVLVLVLVLVDYRTRPSLSLTSPCLPALGASRQASMGGEAGRWQGGLRLRLRGGVWFDPNNEADDGGDDDEELDDEDESYYETTEDEGDAFDQQTAGGVFAQNIFQLPDGTRVDVGDGPLPTRYGDRLTLEQALVDDRHIPAVGTFSGGCDRDIAEIMLARARRHWVDGEVPAEETVPLRLRDVYGLGEFVKLAPEENAERGRPYDAQLDQACDPNP